MNYGLTNKEVEKRINKGLINIENDVKTKSIKKIILDNSLNIFNIVNTFFGIIIISNYAPLFPSHFLSCFGDDDFFECFFT